MEQLGSSVDESLFKVDLRHHVVYLLFDFVLKQIFRGTLVDKFKAQLDLRYEVLDLFCSLSV